MEKQSNFHQIAEDRKALRKEAKEARAPKAKVVEGFLEEVDEEASQFKIEDYGGLGGAKEKLKRDKERMEKDPPVDEKAIDKEFGSKYKEVASLLESEMELREYEMSLLLESKNRPGASERNSRILDSVKNEKASLESQIKEKENTDPQVLRATKLVEYKKGLHREGHIAPTPSVERNLEEIGMRMIAGKPMFLHGPTGTGKTSLARYASEHFTHAKPYMVYCNPQTRESNIWGKTGIRPTEGGGIQTVDIYGPLAKAMQEGRVVIFDEFTALPREQMVFIKGIFNAKSGDTVSVVGNGETKIAPGFQMIFTANLKSEKNPERQELPPEITREFEQNNLEINYTPKEEAYDIMLARLMDKDGSLDLSYHDLQVTLPKFCETMEEVQIAYTGALSLDTARITQTMGASNKTPSLKKFVFTQGTVENILDAWKIERELQKTGRSFVEFLDDRLKTALTFKEYPEADRILVAKILASKGFLRTLSESDLSLPPNTLNFDVARGLRGEKAVLDLVEASGNMKHLSIKDMVDLDPFNLRQKAPTQAASNFIKQSQKPEGIANSSVEEAERIMGKEKVFGAEDIEKSLNIHLKNEDLPRVPFSKEELLNAKNRKEILVYLPDKADDGLPITGKWILDNLNNKTISGEDKKVFSSDIGYTGDFFTKETIRSGWRLMPENAFILLDNNGSPSCPTTSINYVEQTTAMVVYIQDVLYPVLNLMPKNVEEATKEWARIGADLSTRAISNDEKVWKPAVEELANLKINRLFRNSFVEEMAALLIANNKSVNTLGQAINKDGTNYWQYRWTSSRNPSGNLVYVGGSGSDGVNVYGYEPRIRYDVIASAFSRNEFL